MSRKWTQELVKEIRKNEEERQGQMPYLFLPKEGKKAKIEIVDDTFSKIFKGEKGLDKRECTWDQTEISIIDYADNKKKTFKPTDSLASLMWLRCEEKGLNPLDMEGIVFNVERKDTYTHTASIVDTMRIRDGDKHKDDEMASEEQVREVVKKVIDDNDGMGIKELLLWSLEYLKESDLKADKKLVSKIIAEEMKE